MKTLISLILALSLCSCHAINQRLGWEDDNIIEEVAENVLKQKTGIELDFTPDTPEPKAP